VQNSQGDKSIGRAALACDTASSSAGVHSKMRPVLLVYMDWDAQFESSISKVTAAEVHQAFEKYIDPSHLVIVTAGDFR
jgi:hypothetical protein